MIIDHEEVEVLAFRLYKQKMPYDQMIWKLAELCKTISININIPEKECQEWGNLYAFKTIDELKAQLKYPEIKIPSKDEIKPLADKLNEYKPENSKLHWYIAEKTLILEKLKDISRYQKSREAVSDQS